MQQIYNTSNYDLSTVSFSGVWIPSMDKYDKSQLVTCNYCNRINMLEDCTCKGCGAGLQLKNILQNNMR